jgi:hypothetical protein
VPQPIPERKQQLDCFQPLPIRVRPKLHSPLLLQSNERAAHKYMAAEEYAAAPT